MGEEEVSLSNVNSTLQLDEGILVALMLNGYFGRRPHLMEINTNERLSNGSRTDSKIDVSLTQAGSLDVHLEMVKRKKFRDRLGFRDQKIERLSAALRAMVDRWEPDCGGQDRVMWENAIDALEFSQDDTPSESKP